MKKHIGCFSNWGSDEKYNSFFGLPRLPKWLPRDPKALLRALLMFLLLLLLLLPLLPLFLFRVLLLLLLLLLILLLLLLLFFFSNVSWGVNAICC